MFDVTIHTARPLRHDEPDWDPLETFLPLRLCGDFMWMQAYILGDVGQVQAYKHGITRRYLYLDAEGRPYEHVATGFRRMRRVDAVEQVYGLWWALHDARDDEKSMLAELLMPMAEADTADQTAGVEMPPCSPAAALRFIPGG